MRGTIRVDAVCFDMFVAMCGIPVCTVLISFLRGKWQAAVSLERYLCIEACKDVQIAAFTGLCAQ